MKLSGSLVPMAEKRQYQRVAIARSVSLSLNEQAPLDCLLKDLSMGGLFLEGDISACLGERCRVKMLGKGQHASRIVSFESRVLRLGEYGVGLGFIAMENESYMFLQTMMLYASEEPAELAQHFFENFETASLARC